MLEFKIEKLEEVSSTNTLLRKRAEQGAAEGLVLTADYQTEGRGKPGREWVSPRGKNLLFSLLLRPAFSPAKAPLMTQLACRSVAKVLERHYQLVPVFKRPNDILINGKKICGILIEALSKSDHVESLVIGIGLNVNAEGEELFAGSTSIKAETGKSIDRDLLLDQLLRELKSDILAFDR